jgi:hypothetical protein
MGYSTSNQNSARNRLRSRRRESPMEAIFALMFIVAGLVGLDVAALRWGSDSRDPIGDDHTR